MAHGKRSQAQTSRYYVREKEEGGPSVEEQQGGITSLGDNKILAARSIISCNEDVVMADQRLASNGDSDNKYLLLAAGFLVVALLIMRSQ